MSLVRAISLSRRHLPAFAAEGVFWGAYAAYIPQIKAQIGASDADFGLVMLVTAAGAVTAMLLAPTISRLTGRYAMVLSALFLAAAFQTPMWMGAIWVFAGAMFFAGAGAGLLDVIMNARLSTVEAREDTSLMNLNHACFSFVYAATAISAGILRDAGVHPGQMMAGLGLLVVIALPTMMTEPSDAPNSAESSRRKMPLGPLVMLGGLIVLIGFMAENATENWSALHIERTLGGGATEGALGPAMLGLTMGFGRLFGQVIVGRISESLLLVVSALLAALGAVLAALSTTPFEAYVGFATLGLGVAIIAPMMLALAGRMAEKGTRELIISRVTAIGYFGFFIGPPLMGFVAEGLGLRAAFGVMGGLLALIPVALLALRQTSRR